MEWHSNFTFILAAIINIAALASGWADLRRQVKDTVERVQKIDTVLHNGLSERLVRIEESCSVTTNELCRYSDLPARLAVMEARCAERIKAEH